MAEQEERLQALEQRVEANERQIRSLRRQVQQFEEWMDTVCSPPWKRLWWWLQGWRFYRLGRWYNQNRKEQDANQSSVSRIF